MNARNDDELRSDEALQVSLAAGLRPTQLSREQRERMRARLRSSLQAQLPEGMTTLRGADGEWLSINPLVQIKVLRVDTAAGNQTLLLRAAPGAVLPRHRHSREEEFIVLEGECRIGELRLSAGDAHFAAAGSWHEDITTDSGVLVLVRGEYPAPAYA
jgi:quercetin dioxygenase-like cupin family protein